MQQRPSTPSTPTTTLRPAYATTAQSRLTRPKAATRRLLSLDYIIERPTLGWLQTENEKVPYRTYSEWKQVQKRFFTMKFPVAVDAKAATFAYVDPGLTTEPHSRAAHEPSARRAGSRGFTAGFQAADLVTAGFNLRTRAALHTRARAPKVILTEGDVSEGGVAQIPIDAARDLQLRAIDIDILIMRREEVRARQHPVGVGVQKRHIHRPVFRGRE